MNGRKAKHSNLLRRVKVSSELAAIVGSEPLPRSQITSRVWNYIKENNLQDPTDKRIIVPDSKLGKVVGEDRISMFKLTAAISRNTHGSGGGRDD